MRSLRVVVRQNLMPRAILSAEDDPRHGKGFAEQILFAAHRLGLFENRAEGSTHRVQTGRSSRTELDYV
jgi:hypothetical protein